MRNMATISVFPPPFLPLILLILLLKWETHHPQMKQEEPIWEKSVSNYKLLRLLVPLKENMDLISTRLYNTSGTLTCCTQHGQLRLRGDSDVACTRYPSYLAYIIQSDVGQFQEQQNTRDSGEQATWEC